MGRGLHITASEKHRIIRFHNGGYSVRWIAKAFDRDRQNIRRIIKNKDEPVNENRGRKRKLSERNERHIISLALNKTVSSSEILKDIGLTVHSRTVRRVLERCPHLKYRRKRRVQAMTVAHRQARFDWSVHHLAWTEEWKRVIFSDEKKWNLEGPDGLAYYWHDTRQEELTFSKSQMGGGSLMVWGAFCWDGTAELVFIDDRLDADDYCGVLETSLLPFIHRLGIEEWTFQQDNAPIHKARVTGEWFQEHRLNVMEWPAKSPDLNPIENLWGILTRTVYAGNKQYANKQELKDAILRAWANIPIEIIHKLIESMTKRVMECVAAEGKALEY